MGSLIHLSHLLVIRIGLKITSNLLIEQKANDRHDLIVRVFRMKLKELLSDILKKHAFGRPLAHVYTAESKECGLPHAHTLLIFADEHKQRNPSEYDKTVSAELSDTEHNPIVFGIVRGCMINDPCGLLKNSTPHNIH